MISTQSKRSDSRAGLIMALLEPTTQTAEYELAIRDLVDDLSVSDSVSSDWSMTLSAVPGAIVTLGRCMVISCNPAACKIRLATDTGREVLSHSSLDYYLRSNLGRQLCLQHCLSVVTWDVRPFLLLSLACIRYACTLETWDLLFVVISFSATDALRN